uniref:Uncharacterized protein n=1 Tax=Octopus bimaculoides TaxID=37653 RepID=A0A0L8GS01_OCTBM
MAKIFNCHEIIKENSKSKMHKQRLVMNSILVWNFKYRVLVQSFVYIPLV